jgi:Carboxypeptidase regulatory-like domain
MSDLIPSSGGENEMKKGIAFTIVVIFMILPVCSSAQEEVASRMAYRHSLMKMEQTLQWQLTGLEKIVSGKLENVTVDGNTADAIEHLLTEGRTLLKDINPERAVTMSGRTFREIQFRDWQMQNTIRSMAEKLARKNGFKYWKELIDKAGLRERKNTSNAPTGTLRGRVSGSDTGLPLQNVYLSISDVCHVLVDSMYTSPGGLYEFAGLDDGYYYMTIDPESNGEGYIYEVFDNVYSTNNADWIRILDGYTQTLDLELDPGGAISGLYTNILGTPIEGIEVVANYWGSYNHHSATTNAAGTYLITGLRSGNYSIVSQDTYDPAEYPVVGYPDGSDWFQCSPVQVTAPHLKSNIDFTVRRAVYIFGYVTDAVSGLPMEDVYVQLGTESGTFMMSTASEADGRYVLTPVAPGRYSIMAISREGHIIESYDNHYQEFCYDTVEVTPSDTVVGPFNIALDMGGRITGTVIEKDSGLPVMDAEISLYNDKRDLVKRRFSGVDGSYELPELPSGLYYVEVWDFLHTSMHYNEKDRFEAADPITLTAPETIENINFEVESRGEGKIQGTMVDSDGVPLTRAYVDVIDLHGEYVAYGLIDCDGSYEVSHLPTGDYYLHSSCLFKDNQNIWYGNTAKMFDSTRVHVESPHTTANIDFTLSAGPRITGTTLEFGTGYTTVPIILVYHDDWEITLGTSLLSMNPSYEVQGLAPGSYYIEVMDLSLGRHNRKYYINTSSRDTADILTVSGTGVLEDVDFYLKPSGYIHGTVRDEMLTQGISRPAEAVLYNTTGEEIERSNIGRNGHYTIKCPGGEDHYLRIESHRYIDEYYGESITMGGATVVNVPSNAMLYDADITVTPNPIWMELACSPLIAGDVLTVNMFLANSGIQRNIDMYMAMMIESAIYYISLDPHGNWTVSETPAVLSFPLPDSAYYGPIPVFNLPLPAGTSMPKLTVTWIAVLLDSSTGQVWGDLYMEDMEFWPSS